MGHLKIRADKTCLNCYRQVEHRYCGYCGQENVEESRSFIHLFRHFVEDFTHYDNSFWRSMKYLLFKPGFLTQEYLSGRRKYYLNPIRMYIFISFATFLVLSFRMTDVTRVETPPAMSAAAEDGGGIQIGSFTTVRQVDSAQAAEPDADWIYKLQRKSAQLHEQYGPRKTNVLLKEKLIQSLPKFLFIFLPFFALTLWLIHGKRRWFFLDHGVFTLHFFSFILLSFSIWSVLTTMVRAISYDAYEITLVSIFLLIPWWFYYFFRSRYKFYREHVIISVGKSLILSAVNVSVSMILILVAILYSLTSITV